MNAVNIGIIGCGKIVQVRHAPEALHNPNVKIAGFCDFNRARAEETAKTFGGIVYHDWLEMLDDATIDAIVVCSSNDTHAKIAINALKKGKHVLCEKPIAITAEDARNMTLVSEQSGKILMAAQNQRFETAHIKAKSILATNELGKPIRFETTFIHGGPEGWSIDGDKTLWFFQKEKSKFGAMGDLGVHKLDLIRYLFDEPFSSITAYVATLDKKQLDGTPIEVDDSAISIIKMKSGLCGTMNVGWTYYGGKGRSDNSTVIYCEKGIIEVYRDNKYPLVIRYSDNEICKYSFPETANSGIMDSFVSAVINDSRSPIPPRQSCEVLTAIEACFHSSRTGKLINL